jgi:hypothetical protein
MDIPKFFVWYKNSNNTFTTYYYNTKQIETVEILPNNINQFELNDKSYEEVNDDALIDYSKNIVQWRNEIVKCKTITNPFDYFDNNFVVNGKTFYRNHHNNILTFIKRFIDSNYKKFEEITLLEESYYLRCNRGGLVYCNRGIYDCHSFDFKFYYPSIMASPNFKIPSTQGIETIISYDIPKKFKYGIYNVKVISDDINFNKVFRHSPEDYYTNYSLNFCLWYNKTYGDNKVNLKILSTNALIYNKDKLVTGNKIFSCWYNRLLDLKKEYPKNKLVKTLGSTSWGHLTSTNVIIKTDDEINNENLNISTDFSGDYFIKDITIKKDGSEVYKLINTKKPIYKMNFRLKAFLTDYARIYLAKVALNDIDDIVRIQTDGITYNKPKTFDYPNFLPDDKKNGCIEWLNVNKWVHRVA